MNTNLRVFFGLEVEAPWPERLPAGRLVPANGRHMTVAFLGNASEERIHQLLNAMPQQPFSVGGVGVTDRCFFTPNVVAWHLKWLGDGSPYECYIAAIKDHCKGLNFEIDARPFLPHVTIARQPFEADEWKAAFSPIPVVVKALHLYQSLPQLDYRPIWTSEFIPPFVEIEHEADIAFHIQAENMQQLGCNAQAALLFKFPDLIPFLETIPEGVTLDKIIQSLNRTIAIADSQIGSSVKAVSYHGEVTSNADGLLSWEMIIDV
ncbi:MAG: hypothetical protein Q8K75_07600 [Chlamydiales bacterium]|nr:hypothetical protein [Chlamydiales bacterium]